MERPRARRCQTQGRERHETRSRARRRWTARGSWRPRKGLALRNGAQQPQRMLSLVERDLAVFWHPCSQMRDYGDFPPLEIVAAQGCRLTLRDGRQLLDAVSSWWCKSLG